MLACPALGYPFPCNDFARTKCRIEVQLHKAFVKRTEAPITRVAIADPNIADVDLITPRQVLIVSKEKAGITNLILWHGDERAEVYEVVVYIPGSLTKAIQDRINQLAPEARVKVLISYKGIILDGEVESQEMLERVLNIARSYVDLSPNNNFITIRGTQQVQLEVKIAEVSRSDMKKMGLGVLNNKNWTIGVFPGGQASGMASTSRTISTGERPAITSTNTDLTTGVITSTTMAGGSETLKNASRALSSVMEVASPFVSAFQVALHAVGSDSLAILSVLKGQGLARILASPTLVTMSGQEASFMVGGEFPIPISGEDRQTTISFKRFGIMLRFTPTVVSKETITIRVEPEVSNVDYSLSVFSGGVAVPGLKTRRGSTTLQLKDGQTFAMAGLMKEETRTVINKIPFLGDIPILGALFTSKEFQKDETELVIIVTPRLVRAMNRDEVPPLPGEDINDNVSDVDFFLLNRAKNPEAKKPAHPKETVSSPPGFIGEMGFSR